MSEQSENISVRECRVSFLCKICGILFKCVSTYCTHKVENHNSLEFLHNKSIVFEESESNLEPNDKEHGPSVDTLAENEWQTVQLIDLVPMKVKQEPSGAPIILSSDEDTVKSTAYLNTINHAELSPLQNDGSEVSEPLHNSDIKTEWVEDTLVIYKMPSENEDPLSHQNSGNNLQGNKDYEKINCYNLTETQSSFIGSDADADMDPNHEQDDGPDPLEDFDMTQSSQSTSTLATTEMIHDYFNENSSDSYDDLICLDDSPSSTARKIAYSTGSTATATTASNSVILSQLELQCHICSKQFFSSAQLGIHVTICELYNVNIKESAAAAAAAAGSSSQPQAVRSRISRSSRSRRKVKGNSSQRNNFVNCEECSIKIRGCNLIAHLRTEHKIFVEDSDRKYVCHSCGSAFHTRSHLKRHARVHSNEKPFACSSPGCDRAFKDDRNLKHHFKTMHPQLIEML